MKTKKISKPPIFGFSTENLRHLKAEKKSPFFVTKKLWRFKFLIKMKKQFITHKSTKQQHNKIILTKINKSNSTEIIN